MSISGTVTGKLVSKANSRRAVPGRTNTGKSFTRFIKSSDALDFEISALYQLKRVKPLKPLSGSLRLTCSVYYPSRRSDLDVSLFMDILQKAEIIENDRQFDEILTYKFIDALNPRVIFNVQTTDEANLQAVQLGVPLPVPVLPKKTKTIKTHRT